MRRKSLSNNYPRNGVRIRYARRPPAAIMTATKAAMARNPRARRLLRRRTSPASSAANIATRLHDWHSAAIMASLIVAAKPKYPGPAKSKVASARCCARIASAYSPSEYCALPRFPSVIETSRCSLPSSRSSIPSARSCNSFAARESPHSKGIRHVHTEACSRPVALFRSSQTLSRILMASRDVQSLKIKITQ